MKTTRRVTEPKLSLVDLERAGGLASGVEKALGMLPLDRIFLPVDTVAIKPNLVCARAIPNCGTTNPEMLRAVIRVVKGFEVKRIVVAEGSGGTPTDEMLALTGVDRVLDDEGVEFVDLNHPPLNNYSIDHDRPSRIAMNRFVEEIDMLVSLCVLKMHEEATVTASMKNTALAFPAGSYYGLPKADITGIPERSRMDLHSDLHGFTVAMNKLLPIDLAIVEADNVMIGTGPLNGRPLPARMVLAGTDAVAVDAVGARLLGFKPQAVGYLWRALQEGLGEGDPDRMDIQGMDLEDASKLFSQRVFGKEIVVK